MANKKDLYDKYETLIEDDDESVDGVFLIGEDESESDSDYKFNNKIFFDGKWDYLETFKLTFDENNNLINIKNI